MAHPSHDIIGTRSGELKGKKIVLCVCGSVAAVRSADVARELMRAGAEVFCVMSPSAQKIIHPNLMEWATGNEVVTELTGAIEHVALAGEAGGRARADVVLVAPATANTIGKAAYGIDDTPVTTLLTTALGSRAPIIFVPAMHASMYRHPFVLENIAKLRRAGAEFVMPTLSEGKAKIADADEICDYVVRAVREKDLAGKRVVVTAGATRERIDDIRFISNPSTGKMGVAVAREAWLRGADVTLIRGYTETKIPNYVKTIGAGTNDETVGALGRTKSDICILTGAPADFGVRKERGKISSKTPLSLELIPLKKISEVARRRCARMVLFKAESNVSDAELRERARKKLLESRADLIVANDVSRSGAGFGADTNEVLIISKKGVPEKMKGSKREIARRLFDLLSH
ncbi:MAG: bifunctional phosphopantothenoylcysteine decarboxylase/phosphopantothenate--cysteine ligase CoaBC [Candidatus Micrarchaeota archaeon]